MKVVLDDERPGPTDPDWVTVRSIENAKILLKTKTVTFLSLDHDLGESRETGMDLVKWMVENNTWPSHDITIHSANPIGEEHAISS